MKFSDRLLDSVRKKITKKYPLYNDANSDRFYEIMLTLRMQEVGVALISYVFLGRYLFLG